MLIYNIQIWNHQLPFRSGIWQEKIVSYIAGTQGLILAFSADKRDTLGYLNEWLEVVNLYLTEKIPIILISTKNDLAQGGSKEEIDVFMKQNSINHYVETSALNGQNVNEAFKLLTELIAKEKNLI